MEKESEVVSCIEDNKYFINDFMIRIKYNNIDGILNTNTNEVMFYHFTYTNIIEAIRNLEYDINSNEQEIKIFDEIIGNLFITSD